jgi:hypothetical protein
MGKTLVAIVAGLIAWFAIALGLGYVMRMSWAAYAAVADAMTFTLPMMLARLTLGVLATLVGGWLVSRIAMHRTAAPLIFGAALLAIFIPEHIQLWSNFPIWYHLFFLSSLIPLALLGGRIAAPPGNAAYAT